MKLPRNVAVPSLLAMLLLLAPAAPASDVLESFRTPLEPPGTGGVERIDRALAKLSGHRRVLVVGAHPDDEDTTLLALVARGLGGEAAYLSLSRGEGGQNLIGPELGPGLGLIRSQELLAARRVDGARQYFTRAYDFGYTRSLDETLERWPHEVLLEDAVRVVRRFRPQVIVSVFPPDARAGHGQHQAAGLVGGEVYELAGDPAAFPELAREGLAPWRPRALYRNTWWRGREETTVIEPAGVIDPVSGRSVFQIAMASRSSHRSQDMGMLQPLGPLDARLGWEAGGAGAEGDGLFAGVDTSLAAIAAGLPEGRARSEIVARLERVEALAGQARDALSPAQFDRTRLLLVQIVTALREARERVPKNESPGALHAAALLDEKVAVAELALAAAAGVAVDAVADREAVPPGGAWTVDTAAWAAGAGGRASEGVVLGGVELVSPTGLALAVDDLPLEEATGFAAFFTPSADPERGFRRQRFRVSVPTSAQPTIPYFLARPLEGDLYDWSAAPAAVRGEPFGPPPLVARFRVEIDGVPLTLEREVVHRWRDQATGEVRRPLRVVPSVEMRVTPAVGVLRTSAQRPRQLPIRLDLVSHVDEHLFGSIVRAGQTHSESSAGIELPAHAHVERGWIVRPLYDPETNEEVSGDVSLTYAPQQGAARYGLTVPLVDYPHIRPTPYPVPATVRVELVDLELPDLERVGYVRGAADRAPEALTQVGVPVELLAPEALHRADLSVYDAIVVGPRAYESEPVLAEENDRLLGYVRGGGLLIVQYQQYAFVDGGFAPFPLSIARPHGRVTDETAPVRQLVAGHPALHRPNEIGDADWQGWVQERGLYFADSWDDAYVPLLAMRDPDQEEELTGGLLVAPVGEGTYVYTGLAFFRQLPAGVPGAYRLFANLLALGQEGEE
jgi:LmbE family N-acetylglucosaminyl deacetylase